MSTDTMTLDEADIRKLCDIVVERAVVLMVETGAPIGMILDRMLTYAAAQAVSIDGVTYAAAVFHQLADNVESGRFDHLEPDRRGKGH